MHDERSPAVYLELLRRIADRTDPLALARFRAHDLRVDTKRDQTLVTEADLAVEDAARDETSRRHPELALCGEEGGQDADRGAGRLWIDPIDATANFVRGIPIFATLLGVEREGELIAGLVSAPALGTRWSAARGLGAFRDDRRIHVSSVAELSAAQLFHGSLGGSEAPHLPAGYPALLAASKRQRGFGDFYQHVLVAEGAGDLALDPVVQPWDVAALLVIVEEAGGRATSLTGERTIYGKSFVSSNGRLHDTALARLAGR
jgi:histidinol-phosphatase